MKTNLNKWFTIRKLGKNGLGIKIKKQKANHDLANIELLCANGGHWEHSKRIDKLRIDHIYSEWKIKGK